MNKDKRGLEEELKEIAPDFPLPSEEEMFSVPSGYFQDFKMSILEQTTSQRNTVQDIEPKTKPIFRLKNYWQYAAAASVVLLISIYFLFGNDQQSDERYVLNANDGIQYILDNLDELDESLIADLMNYAAVDLSEDLMLNIQIEDIEMEFELDEILEGFDENEIDNLFEDIN